MVTRVADVVADDSPQRNKALVLEAMTTLFQRHDASVIERLYAADYIQHNPAIPQGREALKALISAMSKDVYYEPGLMIAQGDLVELFLSSEDASSNLTPGVHREALPVPEYAINLLQMAGIGWTNGCNPASLNGWNWRFRWMANRKSSI